MAADAQTLDPQTAKSLADYFSSSAGAATLEPPTPTEGGEGETGELTPVGKQELAQRTLSADDAQKLADQIQSGPISPLASAALTAAGPVGPLLESLANWFPPVRELIKGEAATPQEMVGGTASMVRGLVDMFRSAANSAPENNFIGKPLPEVQAQRDQLQAQHDQLEQQFNEAIKTGKMGGLQATAASAEINEFQRKIDEANGILASGQVKTAPVQEAGPLKYLSDSLRGVQEAVPAERARTEEALPTTQELDQSIAGQILRGAGQLGSQLPFMFAGPEVAAPAFAAQFAGSGYDEARAKGADDRTAQIAALMDAMGAGLQVTALEAPAASLAKMLEGSTPTKAILDVGRAVAMGGFGMGGLQAYQNFVAEVSGYDPDRPLYEGVLQQALLGAGLDAFATAAGRVPGLLRYARPAQVEVRERPGAPPIEGAAPPPAPPVEPVQPAPTTEPLAEATAQARASTGVAPEQALAQVGTPEQALAQSQSELSNLLQGAAAEPTAPVMVPQAQPAPEAAPSAAAEPPAYEPPTPYQRFEPPPKAAPGASVEELARWNVWNGMIATEQAALRGARVDSPQVAEFNAQVQDLASRYREAPAAPTVAQSVAAETPAAAEQRYLSAVTEEGRQRYFDLPPEDRARLLRHFQSASPVAANLRGEALPPALPEMPIDAAQVKATTNQAATDMGLEQRIHYVASADDLPGRVRKALTDEQRGTTAQTIYDKTLGELWVIGDRFSNQQELNHALLNDTLPKVWGDVADLRIEHNPNDPRLGYYDIGADRPVLNEAAIMRSADPFKAASQTALEEIVTHSGISKLYGSREAPAYVAAMRSVRQRFDSLGLSEILAREKGFGGLEDMARAYGYEDYASNPAHNNALTEELIGAYAQRYQTRAALEGRAPTWYQQALNTLGDGLRRRWGLGISDVDVQNLVADSFGALRTPKYTTPALFQPEVGAQAKRDMANYQLAALRGDQPEGAGGRPERPEGQQTEFLSEFDKEQRQRVAEEIAAGREPPPLPTGRPPASAEALAESAAARAAAGQVEMARIGDLFVAGQRLETRAGLQPGEGIRATPTRLSMQQNRPFDERMELAKRATSVYDKRSLDSVMNDARQIFQRDFGDDVYRAMDDIRNAPASDADLAMRAVVNEATNNQIGDLRSRGFSDAARSLEMTRDKFNRDMSPKITLLAQALNAVKLLYETAEAAVGRLQAGLIKAQGRIVGRGQGVAEAYRRIGQIGQNVARQTMARLSKEIDTAQARMDRLTSNPQSLATRYIQALADSINDRMGRLGFTAPERPILQELFNRFGSTIQELINEKREPIPTPEAAQKMSATDTIRETLANFPMFQRAWDETVSRLKTDNPNALFFQKLDNALAEPFGEKAVGRVIRESGNDLRDLIFRHFTTQGRIGNELAQGLTERLGLTQAQAMRVQQIFDDHYRHLLNTTAAKELEQTIARIGNPAQRAKGELERLTDLMAIGALDKEEYHNLLARRFGLGAWDPENMAIMKQLGSELKRIHDESGPEVFKNQVAAQLADAMARTQPWKSRALRQVEGLWMASLLTGPFTHGSYYLQNGAQVMLNMALRNMASLARGQVGLGDVARAYGDMFNGMIHSARNELPFILQTGFHTQRELPGGEVAGMRAEGIPFRGALESTPLAGGMANPLNWYRYVGRFLHGMETVFYRGAQNGITRTLAIRMADERGMASEEAQRWAEQMVYGTENDRQEAIQQAAEEQKKFKLSDQMRDIRVQELIDQKRFARAPELADEAHRFALHSIYRESPYGWMGKIAQTLSALRRDNPQLSAITPFINLPANVANEFMNWTPIGVLRGRDALFGFRGGTQALESMYKDVPQFHRLVESGGISDRELRDLSYEYLAKGVIGTAGMVALGALTVANRDNPAAAPLAVNGAGPPEQAHRDALRATGWQPYSVRIGDMNFSYAASPFKSALALVGGAADQIRYGKGDPQNWIGAALNVGVGDLLSSVTDASFLQGLQTILASASGGGGPEVDRKLGQFFSQEAASAVMIPFGGTGTRQIYRLFEPRQFEAKDPGSMVMRNIPGLNSAFLQPKLNVLGEPVESSPINRIIPSQQTSDPVWRFIDQHNLNISLPNAGRRVNGEQLSPAELHEFTQVRGQYLKQELAAAINDAQFRSLDPEQMDAYVKELERAADEVGKYQIWQRRGVETR